MENRIKELREAKGWSQTRLAQAIGANKSQVSRLEKGERGLTEEWIRKIADALGNPPAMILTEDLFYHHHEHATKHPPADTHASAPGPVSAPVPAAAIRMPPVPVAEGNFVLIPVYDAAVFAPGAQPAAFNPYRPDWLKRLTKAPAGDLAVIRIAGDASRPILGDGDEVLVDITINRWRRDGLYVTRYGADDEATVKRLVRNPRSRTLTIISDNPDYPSFDGIKDSEITVIGRVIWLGRALA